MPSGMQRMFATAAAVGIILILAGATAQGQGGGLRWVKMAPFPEPDEEYYGVAANGRMYVIGGFGHAPLGKPPGLVYEYDPAADKWTKKKNIPLPVHHQAQTEYRGKIYIFGGFTAPETVSWQPVDNAWEFDPVADSWKALAPMPIKRGSAIAEQVGGKIYVIGGATTMEGSNENALLFNRPTRVLGTNQVYDPATNKWESRADMPTTRNHAFSGVVNGKIYVIGGRQGSAFNGIASPTDVVEEYDPATDLWFAKAQLPTPRSGGGSATYGGKIYVAGGEWANQKIAAAFRALEAYDPATNMWSILPSMPSARHGNAAAFIGNQLHEVSGSAEFGGAPDTDMSKFATGSHDVLEIPEH